MRSLSINEAIDRLDELAGQDVLLHGILSFEFEHIAIYHSPNAERRSVYGSSIWLKIDRDAEKFNFKEWKGLSGKHVIVSGQLAKPKSCRGTGHMGLWPAELFANALDLYSI